jgi:acyl-CoA thioester hydrolase
MSATYPPSSDQPGAASTDYDAPSEFILQRDPFIVRRIVKWHECDPAGVVYAGNFTTYAGCAARLFLAHVLGGPFHRSLKALGVDLPAKAHQLVFYSSLWPDDYFDMEVSIVRIGGTSFTSEIIGKTLTGKLVFAAHLTSICVVPGGPNGRQAVAIPDALRSALQARFNPSPHKMAAET